MQRIGLAGFGFIGKTHFEAYHSIPNVTVTAICSKTKPEKLEEFSGAFLDDYDELLKREDVDIVDICVPTFLHEEYIVKAAKAKKHIICEKPLTLTLEAAERIIKTVKEEGVQLFVGHVLRFWPEYQLIKEYTKNTPWETVEIVHAKRLGKLPEWSGWFQYPEKSGGALFDLHIHDIDFVYYLFGDVESVYAVGKQNKYRAWDHVMTTLTFKGGTEAFVEASHRMPDAYPFTMEFRMQAQQNLLDFKLGAGENIEQMNECQFVCYEKDQLFIPTIKAGDAFQNELSYFVDCVENNQENEVIPLADVLYVMKLMEAIEQY